MTSKINFTAPINDLGYGVVGLNTALALERQDCEVALWPIGQVQADKKYGAMLQKMVDRQESYDILAPSVRLWHQFDLAQHIGVSNIHIGWPIFELDRFTKREEHHMRMCDHLFVCSQWAKDIVVSNPAHIKYKTNVHVIHLGVNPDIFNRYHRDTTNKTLTTFLMCGKWEVRKGHDFALQAFENAFDVNDNVRLLVLCDNPFLKPEQMQYWRKLCINNRLGSKILLLPRQDTQSDVANVMASADCGLFLSRAEGWNLELLEMMALGKPVIATNYSGHTEFCCKENAYLVDIDTLEDAEDGIWFHKQGRWAALGEHQMEQTVTHMRYVHQNKSGLLNIFGIVRGAQFTWENTAKEIINELHP